MVNAVEKTAAIGENNTPGAVVNKTLDEQIAEAEAEMTKAGLTLKDSESKVIDVSKVGAAANKLQLSWTFTVFYRDVHGQPWAGSFTAKILNNRELIQVGVMKAQLAGGQPTAALDDYTNSEIYKQSMLSVSITDAPGWWKPLDMVDLQIVDVVYAHIADKQSFFRTGKLAEQRSSAASNRQG